MPRSRPNPKNKKKGGNIETQTHSKENTNQSQQLIHQDVPINKVKPTFSRPFISVVTPTYNRRKFIPYAIKCFEHQTYPRELMEWVIIDDGEDKIEDLVKDVPGVKYFPYDEKIKLGRKRNIMHEKCNGDIIVYFDDDDYYPPERVATAVMKLQSNKEALAAGSSRLHIYFKHIDKIYEFGPYGPRHSTAGTFAIKRELLKQTRYEDDAVIAEEKQFLKNYTIPFVQLPAEKTILVCSHDQNTFDKKILLNQGESKFMRETSLKIKQFIKNKELREFYKNA